VARSSARALDVYI